MKHSTLLAIATVHQYCKSLDKSTEFTYQTIQDICKVDLDTVNNYFIKYSNQHETLFNEINTINEIVIKLLKSYIHK